MNAALKPGYAFCSTRRHPRDPEIVVVGAAQCQTCKEVGSARIDGAACVAFKMPGRKLYFFQQKAGAE